VITATQKLTNCTHQIRDTLIEFFSVLTISLAALVVVSQPLFVARPLPFVLSDKRFVLFHEHLVVGHQLHVTCFETI